MEQRDARLRSGLTFWTWSICKFMIFWGSIVCSIVKRSSRIINRL
jgi:hypothetical protein